MKYLRSEHLKFKRTISNKLLWIAPLVTAIFAWIIGGFIGFQYMTFYWWYAFLLPGTIAILCAMSQRKEERAGKYYSILSMPINLMKFEFAKAIVLIEKLLVASLFLSMFISVANLISPAMAVYSVSHCFIGSTGVILASVWQIPLCLYLARKTGLMLPVAVNSLLGIFAPIIFGHTSFWFLCPYTWSAKLAQPLLGIEINGTYTGDVFFSWHILLVLSLSILLFSLLAFLDAMVFSYKEGN